MDWWRLRKILVKTNHRFHVTSITHTCLWLGAIYGQKKLEARSSARREPVEPGRAALNCNHIGSDLVRSVIQLSCRWSLVNAGLLGRSRNSRSRKPIEAHTRALLIPTKKPPITFIFLWSSRLNAASLCWIQIIIFPPRPRRCFTTSATHMLQNIEFLFISYFRNANFLNVDHDEKCLTGTRTVLIQDARWI
jgi:hypothetical protein